MPTVCKITLDATEYRRELEAVVAASRAASAQLTESFDGFTTEAAQAEIERLKAELAALEGKSVSVATEADRTEIERLKAEIEALQGKSVNIATDADIAAIERLKAELAALEGKTVSVATEADLAEIERLKAELAALDGKSVNIATDADIAAIERLKAELAALEGKDVSVATEADLAEIERLKAEIEALQGKSVSVATEADLAEIDRLKAELAALEGKDISVITEADRTEIQKLKAELATLEDKKFTIQTEVESEGLDRLPPKLAETETQAKGTSSVLGKLIPPALKAKAAEAFRSIRTEMNNTAGGAKNLFSKFLAGGGAIGIIVAGVASLGKIAMTAYNSWIGRMKEAGKVAQRNAASIRETAEANEKLRQKSDGYLSQLQTLASQEQLSNANKAEARKLISDLAKSYGDLGVQLDETTGKLTGVDAAIIKKAQRDKERRIQELEAEREQLKADNAAQERVRDKAGIPVWFGGDVRLGGKEDIEAAAKQIEANGKRAIEIMRELNNLQQEEPAEDIRAKKAGEVADLSKSYRDQTAAFKERQADDAFAGEQRDGAARIANRQGLIDQHRREKVSPLEDKVAAAQNALNTATGDDKVEAERNLLQLQKELQTEREKAYSWERQINEIKKQQALAYEKLVEQSRFELDYNALILNGEHDKAAALKMEKELKDQNLKLTAAETAELAKQRAALASQNLAKSQQAKAYDLYGQAMEKSGKGREFTEQKAIREARDVKGRELTEGETSLVKKLSELSWGLENRRETQYGDLSVMSNSLTSRGGFQGGAKVPDSEKINREIANTNKSMLQVLQRIEAINREMGVFK